MMGAGVARGAGAARGESRSAAKDTSGATKAAVETATCSASIKVAATPFILSVNRIFCVPASKPDNDRRKGGVVRLSSFRGSLLMTSSSNHPLKAPDADLVARFAAIVGANNAITDTQEQAPFLKEWRDLYVGRAAVILKPGSTQEVSSILALANAEGVGVVAQGGNTGLVGGQIPSETGAEIVLSLARMKTIRNVDAAGGAMTVEAGATLADAQKAAQSAGRLFPLSLASEGSATIGGCLATNAGGVSVLSYGTARALVSGLEVVLADGRVWDGLRALKKDNTGYDLRDLFVGSEGTLGIITAATLRLFPEPASRATGFAALPGLDALLPFFQLAEAKAGASLTAFEFMSGDLLSFVTRHIPGARSPLPGNAPWYVLLEISGGEGQAGHVLEALLADASLAGLVSDATVAASLAQASELWRLRESASESQKGEGGSIKHDISVPVGKIPEFLIEAGDVVQRVCPGARPVPFGHFGDGNVHYNVSQPVGMARDAYLALWEEMSRAVHDVVVRTGGSISAEHGIGRLKRDELVRVKSAVEIDLMLRIKSALDPKGILNPGKVVAR
jgi:FAD/FMN-containing dehydrogenase